MANIPPVAGKSVHAPHSANLSTLIERNWFARESYFIRKLADDRLRDQRLDTRESHELAKRAERAWAEADANLKAHMKAT
jgi:hypothetical protein